MTTKLTIGSARWGVSSDFQVFSNDAETREVEKAFVIRLVKTGVRHAVLAPRWSRHGGTKRSEPAATPIMDLTKVETVIELLDAGVMDHALTRAAEAMPAAPTQKFEDVKEMSVRDWAARKGVKIPG